MGTGPNFSYLPSAGDVITCKMTSNYLCRLANTATSAPPSKSPEGSPATIPTSGPVAVTDSGMFVQRIMPRPATAKNSVSACNSASAPASAAIAARASSKDSPDL